MTQSAPAVVVFTTLFPSPSQPQAGIFIRERMARVAQHLPVTVVAPLPWFPLQSLIRRLRPHFRPPAPPAEMQGNLQVLRPRFLCVPGVLKWTDGLFLALGALPTLLRLKRAGRLQVLDAHFAYPEGYAAGLLGAWLGVPVTVTLRGTEARHARTIALRPLVRSALSRATRIFAVADALKRTAISVGVPASAVRVVGNGVDADKFRPLPQSAARAALGLPADAKVMVTVGGLVERKGFHRVIACMPELMRSIPALHYLVVGGASVEGDMGPELRRQVAELQLQARVHFLGPVAAERLAGVLAAADVFVLATRNEGWANVILEAMACGLPVIATDVGGNREVVAAANLGMIVPFGDHAALAHALSDALRQEWDRGAVRRHAEANAWPARIAALIEEFRAITGYPPDRQGTEAAERACASRP